MNLKSSSGPKKNLSGDRRGGDFDMLLRRTCSLSDSHDLTPLDCLAENGQDKENLLNPRTRLPNFNFLAGLMEICHSESCASRYPIALTQIELEGYSTFEQIYSSLDLERTDDLVIKTIRRSFKPEQNLLIQGDSGIFVVVSFETSLSEVTRSADEIRKALTGLTIPYPHGMVSSKVIASIGIAFVEYCSVLESWRDFLVMADRAQKKNLHTGRLEILSLPL